MPRPATPTLTPYTEQLPDVGSPSTWATRTPLFWNWVTGPGYSNLDNLLNYTEGAIDFIDAALAGSETVVDAVAGLQEVRPIAIGGTGATTASGARSNLGAQASLGFTPIQQGGGASQGTDKIYIGWDGAGSRLRFQVGNADQGRLALQSEIPAAYSDGQARSAQAGHQAGAVGSYAFCRNAAGNTLNANDLVAGSSLRYANASGQFESGTPSGTWRCMGRVENGSTGSLNTLFLRVG